MRGFTINKNEGDGFDIAVLMKKSVRKVDVCDSIVNRNRSHDGINLLQEDSFYNIDTFTNYEKLLDSTYPPFLTDHLSRIMENRNEYDGKGIIRGSAKRGNADFLKELEGMANIDISDISCIECHHFLPVYMCGGKGCIELCKFK